jgi:hypothetical protein
MAPHTETLGRVCVQRHWVESDTERQTLGRVPHLKTDTDDTEGRDLDGA